MEKLRMHSFSLEDQRAFYEAGIRIAQKKIKENSELAAGDGSPFLPRIATGGSFHGLFLWDTVFGCLWAKYEASKFPLMSSLDNFYNLQEEDGYICREFLADGKPAWARIHPISFNPPILAWAELDLYQAGISGRERLEKVYPHLKKHHEFCRKQYRTKDGLYFSDALGCGMDDLPRMPKEPVSEKDLHAGIDFKVEYGPGVPEFAKTVAKNPLYCWNSQMNWIDTSAQMAFNALNLSEIAKALENESDYSVFRKEHTELKELINLHCWDEKLKFYFDSYNGRIIPRYHAGAFWTLIAEIVPESRKEQLLETMKNEAIFNRPIPFPSLGANEKEYDSEHAYWLGSVWPPTNYVALRGLRAIGAEDFAREAASRYYNANLKLFKKTGTIWENISPEQSESPKERAFQDFCGWGNLAPVAIWKEFLS